MNRIVLIACSSKKKNHPAKGKDLYDSHLFKSSLKYAELLKPDEIFILSAKFGLLDPEEVISPYNVTLNNMPSSEVKAWASSVANQLKYISDIKEDHFIILAGVNYRKHLLPYLSSYEVPMEGLRIGQQLQYLKHRVSS